MAGYLTRVGILTKRWGSLSFLFPTYWRTARGRDPLLHGNISSFPKVFLLARRTFQSPLTLPSLEEIVKHIIMKGLLIGILAIAGYAIGIRAQCPDYAQYSQQVHEPLSSGRYAVSFRDIPSQVQLFNSDIARLSTSFPIMSHLQLFNRRRYYRTNEDSNQRPRSLPSL